MKKRILATLLSLCLVIGLLPVTVMAIDRDSLSSTGGELRDGAYLLEENVTLINNIVIPEGATVTIDLNGKTLTGNGDGSVIWVKGTLTLNDSSAEKSGLITGGSGTYDSDKWGQGRRYGLAIYVTGSFTMNGGTIANNHPSESTKELNSFGGAIMSWGEVTLNNVKIKNNQTSDWGGGICIGSGTLSMTNCVVEDNQSTHGGGIYAGGVEKRISDTIVRNNVATANAGGIYLTGGSLSIYNTDVYQNRDSYNSGDGTSNDIFVIDTAELDLSGKIRCDNLRSKGSVKPTLSGLAAESKIIMEVDLPFEEGRIAFNGKTTISAEEVSCISYSPAQYVSFIENNSIKIGKALTISFDKNGGEGTIVEQKVASGKGAVLSTNTFTRDGYTFAGWNTAQDGTGTAYADGAEITTSEDLTLYAQWTPKHYSISYELNGGTNGESAPTTHTYGTATELVSPSRTGYTFDGWYTNNDFSGSKVESLGATDYVNDITLYAQWTPNTYTINFSGGPGASGSTASVTATYDQPATLTANGFTMAGKDFAGWATSQEKANAGTVEYGDQTDVKNLAASGTVTLYAVWTDKQVLDPDLTDTVVTYNGQPQKFHVDGTYTVKYSQNRVEVTAPTNAGVYDVEISRAEDDTYAAYHGRVVGGLVIKKAPLTIKADDQSIRVGSTLPEYTYTVIGWQGSDGDTVALKDVSAACTDADPTTAGDYIITVDGPASIDNYTITYVGGTLTVSRRSSGGGSGSGSSGGTTTETEKNPDGSTTTTVTDKKTGTVTETTKFKDGSTLVVETQKDGTVTTTETAKNGVKVKTVDEPGEDVTAKVTIPRNVGEAVVTIPADVDYGMVAVDAKTGEVVKLSVPTEDGMTVKLDGSAELVLVERSLDFTDTNNHWAEDAIDFATAHELFAGTSDTTFSPDSSMTRAMLMTVLARFDGQDTTGGAVWYEKAMAWAKENGISDGSNPNGNITREQFATMLWRYAGSPAVSGMALNEFGDSASVNGYAVDAMRWAVSSGIIGGTDAGLLMPQGNATRAQVATMLMRFVEGLTK